jgi:hypothetical protein
MQTVPADKRGTIMRGCLGIVEVGAKVAATREERNGVRGRIMDVLEVLVAEFGRPRGTDSPVGCFGGCHQEYEEEVPK